MGRVRVSGTEQTMENDAVLSSGSTPVQVARPASYSPGADPVLASRGAAVSAERERTGVFTSLVKEDGDIAGLVAYSIYKQNKLDWLQAFEAVKGRVPDEPELSAYIIGESTPRRLATYRHLAEATLAGHGPDVDGAVSPRPFHGRDRKSSPLATPRLLVTYGIIGILFVIAFWAAAHYTLSGH